MAEDLGRNAGIGIGVEVTPGTPVAAALWARLNSVTINKSRPLVRRERLRLATDGFGQERINLVEDVAFSYTIDAQYEQGALGLVLRTILGGTWVDTGSGPTYDHDLEPGLSLPAHTLRTYRDNGDEGDILAGCRVSSATIEVSTPGKMTITVNGLAMSATTGGAAPTPSYGTDRDPILHHEGGTLAWNSATYTVRSLSLAIENAVEGLRSFGNRGISSAKSTGVRTARLTLGRYKENDDWHDGQIAATESTATIQFTDGTNVFEIELNNAAIPDEVALANTTVGLVEESAVFEGRHDGTNAAIEVTLTNADATAEAS